jgi:23S rRNA pseudouridine2605 synthase
MSKKKKADEPRPELKEDALIEAAEAESEDPIGDETDGEAESSAAPEDEEEIEAAEEDSEDAAETDDESEEEAEEEDRQEDGEAEFTPKVRPPAKLERLQKILAQSGVASRRKAEEMIEQGRVQVNGKVVTALGTKADAGRDHIRVDGKLLQGAERLRYFVLNKPRGFVTTVKDPEGRPTVMQFFDKMRERLYPVGRLDYLSEGLLLVTNDGELANKLTRAAAGVEKTYLVKVAGIPSESELDILRAGVAIEKGKPGSGKVRTSPARIRQVRQGDNPWYEVVLIEGRNRELRKMFEEVGHFVEKIRRVGYGPLILDQEPGNLRELDTQELELLRKAADGKWKTPKAKEIRRRNIVDSLPPEKPAFKARGERPAAGPKDYKPKKAFGTDRPVRGGTGPAKFGPGKFGPAKFGADRASGSAERPAWKKDDRAGRTDSRPPARFAAPAGERSTRERSTGDERPAAGRSYGDRPAAGRTFGAKPAGRTFGDKPAGRTFGAKPGGRPFAGKPASGGRSFPPKPGWKKPEGGERPQFKKPFTPRPEATRRPAPEPVEDLEPRKQFKIHIEPIQDSPRDSARTERPSRPSSGRPPAGRTSTGRPPSGYSSGDRSGGGRASTGRPSSARPFRSEGGMARPFTTSSGKPRAGGARPSSKPGKEGGRSYGAGAGRGGPRTGSDSRPSFGGKRPFTPRSEGSEGFRPRGEDTRPERKTGTGWKPKPSFGGKPKPSFGGKPKPSFGGKPKPGGFSKSGSKGSGFKGKTGGSGAKRTGPRPGGKKPGGRRP